MDVKGHSILCTAQSVDQCAKKKVKYKWASAFLINAYYSIPDRLDSQL